MSPSVLYDKFILVVTNFSFIIPLCYASSTRDILRLIIPAVASMFHHAAENRFYKPALLDVSPHVQDLFLAFDRLFAATGVFVFGSIELLQDKWPTVISLFGAMLLSDLVMYNESWSLGVRRILRVSLHSFWHIFIFAYLGTIAVTRYRDSVRFYEVLFPCIAQ